MFRKIKWLALFAIVTTSYGCKKTGSEAGPCFENGTCNGELKCYSNLCVKAPDCDEDDEEEKTDRSGKGGLSAMLKYRRKALTIEATESLDKIKAGARQYYVTDHWDSNGNLLPKGFPTGIKKTPPKPFCKKTLTPTTTWDRAGWGPIHFALTEPHLFSFSFESSGSTGTSATYTARAHGDLDCDGVLSTYELRGSIDSEGSVKVVGPIISNEIE